MESMSGLDSFLSPGPHTWWLRQGQRITKTNFASISPQHPVAPKTSQPLSLFYSFYLDPDWGIGMEAMKSCTAHLGIPLILPLGAMIVPEICARHYKEGCLSSDSPPLGLAANIISVPSPVPFILLSQSTCSFSYSAALLSFRCSCLFSFLLLLLWLLLNDRSLFSIFGTPDITLTQLLGTA